MMENVRMGELAVSATAGDELIAIGLGSCIALALADFAAGVAGMAHIVLPDSLDKSGPAAKFADRAVPEMIKHLEQAGASRARLQAALIGGASMFTVTGLDIGTRNTEAVRAALAGVEVPIRAQEVGGNRGRTARVVVGGEITTQYAGGQRTTLLTPDPTGASLDMAGATR